MQKLPESPSPVLFQMGGGEATHNLPQHWSLTLKPHGIVGLHSGRWEPWSHRLQLYQTRLPISTTEEPR